MTPYNQVNSQVKSLTRVLSLKVHRIDVVLLSPVWKHGDNFLRVKLADLANCFFQVLYIVVHACHSLALQVGMLIEAGEGNCENRKFVDYFKIPSFLE